MKPGANVSPQRKEACYWGQGSKTRENLFCTSGGDAKETRYPCTIGNRCCTPFVNALTVGTDHLETTTLATNLHVTVEPTKETVVKKSKGARKL